MTSPCDWKRLLVAQALVGTLLNIGALGYEFHGGTGTLANPYEIADANDLIAMGSDPNLTDKHFVLVADIDLAGTTWSTALIPEFSGTFDGNGFTIRGLTIVGEVNDGLFGYLAPEARVHNVGVVEANVANTWGTVGILAGCNAGAIVNCYSTGSVSGDWAVGGLVGWNAGTVTHCHSAGAVDGNSCAGGLVGYNDRGGITQCYSTGSVSAYGKLGGLVGYNDGSVTTCYSTGTVSGDWAVGGLVGTNGDEASVACCYSIGAVSGNDGVGGLVGGNDGGIHLVAKCFWNVDTSGLGGSVGGEGLSTAQMQDIQTYLDAGWDFVGETENGVHESWQMPDGGGYPVFNGYRRPELAGHGTPEAPYVVSTVMELGAMYRDPTASYSLAASVDLSDVAWSVAVVPSFSGTFRGNGFAIQRLTLAGSGHLGLFGLLQSGAEVHDVDILDVNVTGSGAYTGGLVGYNDSARVTRCHSTGTTSGGEGVGGLVGYSNGGHVVACYSDGAVSGGDRVGGLIGGIGYAAAVLLADCHSAGTVAGESYVGGLVGTNDGGGVTRCYSTSTVSGNESVGGLAGYNRGRVTHCYSIGTVAGDDNVGGLVGENNRLVLACFWNVETSGITDSGGGKGLSAAQMQDIQTYLDAGWDFVGETENGVHESWQMSDGDGYPVLGIFNGYRPPELLGQGTPADPYLISTVAELGAVHHEPAASYQLTASLDLSGMTWSFPVVPAFSGAFNGDGFTVRGLTIAGGGCLGLFGSLESGAEICDLGLLDVNVTGAQAYHAGGLLGHNENGSVTRCYSTGTISGNYDVGGLVGYSEDGRIARCYSAAAVFGTNCVGGLVGTNYDYDDTPDDDDDDTLADCYSTGPVSGDWAVGGLVGYNDGGGVTRCSSTSFVSGPDTIGGLVGAHYGGTLRYCYSTGIVAGESFVGGLVATNGGTVADCYSSGTVSGDDYVGGLLGHNEGDNVNRCYSIGAVSGTDDVGGLIGSMDYGSVTDCFWDIDTSGVAVSAGGSGLTTAAMQIFLTYTSAGWDFVGETENGAEDIWFMPPQGYPRLFWESPASESMVGVHRLWSPTYERHFYTIDESEKDEFLSDSAGTWTYEGLVCYAFAEAVAPDLAPVHRFYSTSLNAYFYTISEAEKDMLIDSYAHTWTYQGVAFYVFAEGRQPSIASPVYRFWSGVLGCHFYTMSEAEKDYVINHYAHVWTFEGIAWYAYSLPQVPAETIWLPDYAPLLALQDSLLTFEWTYGQTGHFTCQIGDPVTVDYGDGTRLTGVTMTNLFGWEEGGITALVSNDGSSVKILGFEDPVTGESWYASSDEYLTSHPALMSYSAVADGMMIDKRGSYWVTEDGRLITDIGSANLFQIQDITVPAGDYEDALVVWDLRTDASFVPLDWNDKDTALGIVSPTAADTGGFAIAGVWIFGRQQGPIASAAHELDSGRLIHLAELKSVQDAR